MFVLCMCQETCFPFWPEERTETADCKLVKVNYKDTIPMKNCDKILLEVFRSAKVWPTIIYVLYIMPQERWSDSWGSGVHTHVCASNCLNSALQSPNGGSPVPLQRLDHCQTTSCCCPAEGDGRSGRHSERNRQTSSGDVRVSAAPTLPLPLITNTSTPCMWPKLLYHVPWSDWDFSSKYITTVLWFYLHMYHVPGNDLYYWQ